MNKHIAAAAPKLTATAEALLRSAAKRDDRYLMTHVVKMPAAARNSVASSLLKRGLVDEVTDADPRVAWWSADNIALRINDTGLLAIGIEPAAAVATPGRRDTLRQAAQAVLDAWNPEEVAGMAAPMARLRAVLAGRTTPRAAAGPRGPRDGTKKATVLALLRRAKGASGPEIADATGWNSNTVRGFLAGLKKQGIEVTNLGRGSDAAKGSVYRITG